MELERLEFLPLDLGARVGEEAKRKLVALAAKHGWVDVFSRFDERDRNALLPNAVAVLECDNRQLYIAGSGFAVMSVSTLTEGVCSEEEKCARALLERLKFHRAVESGDYPGQSDPLSLLIEDLRIVIADQRGVIPRLSSAVQRFEYALTVFVHDARQPECTAALLSPRAMGCSASDALLVEPDVTVLASKIREAEPPTRPRVALPFHGAAMYSSWSTVVIERDGAPGVEDLIRLV